MGGSWNDDEPRGGYRRGSGGEHSRCLHRGSLGHRNPLSSITRGKAPFEGDAIGWRLLVASGVSLRFAATNTRNSGSVHAIDTRLTGAPPRRVAPVRHNEGMEIAPERTRTPVWRDPLSLSFRAHRQLLLLRLRFHERRNTDPTGRR